MTNEQIKYMVDRFLQWKLPENFNPDCGISFKRVFNENTPWPMKHEPVGTNLLDATQAETMVRYMVDGLPTTAAPELEKLREWKAKVLAIAQEYSGKEVILKYADATLGEKGSDETNSD